MWRYNFLKEIYILSTNSIVQLSKAYFLLTPTKLEVWLTFYQHKAHDFNLPTHKWIIVNSTLALLTEEKEEASDTSFVKWINEYIS